MNASKILLSAAAFALIATPAFATSEPASAETAPTESSIDTATAPTTPTTEAAPSLDAPADTLATEEAAPATEEIPAEPTMAAPATIDDTTAAPAVTEEAPPAEPVVEAPKPVVKKKSPPAKLSALSKKYDLMSLDTDGNKSLSKEEFTANGFSNAKTFAAFDADHNGKLTNSEINAYAARIEANSKK